MADAARGPVPERVYPSGLTMADIVEFASEDPDDRAVRSEHGFSRDDTDDTLCPRGCDLTYGEVSSGKIRKCRGRDA